ncbi:MAG: hypothetical protein GWN01_12460 [Nitrosopumilaceae archaeon]|nr:hypothetical protein [Nitrosopumilaceae archaeon]NIX62288.1 hypothetical protein [Nitrosopumilaceae archaeon]
MDVPEGQQTSEEKKKDTEQQESKESEIDFSLFQPREESTPLTISQEEPVTQTSASPSSAQFTEEETGEEEEEPISFEGSFSKKKTFWFIGIGIAIVLIALFITLLLGPDTSEETTASRETSTNVRGPSAPTGEQSSVPAFLQNQFAQNQQQNQHYLNLAKNFLSLRVPNAGYSMLVFTSTDLYVSVLANSRNEVAEFRQAVKEYYPRIKMNIESVEPKFVNGQEKLLADFSIPIAQTLSSGSASASQSEALNSENIQTAFTRLAREHGLNTTYFKKGDKEAGRNMQQNYFYANVIGSNRSSVLSYLSELAAKFPSIKMIKISIYPVTSAIIQTGNIKARIEFAYFFAAL